MNCPDTLIQIDYEIEECRWAASFFRRRGQVDEARRCLAIVEGLERARRIVERVADRMEDAA